VCTGYHQTPPDGRSGTYHRKIAALARALVGLTSRPSGDREWLDSCWLTDVVKCSTVAELGGVDDALARNCATFLRDEIRLARPSLIVALGGRAFREASAVADGVAVVKFRHPSNGVSAAGEAIPRPSLCDRDCCASVQRLDDADRGVCEPA
jgi:hypothetical protein